MRPGKTIFAVLLCLALPLFAGCGLFSKKPAPEVSPASPIAAGTASAAPAAQRAVAPEAAALVQRAIPLWGRHGVCTEPEKALPLLDSALRIDPDYADALLWRGRALSDEGYLEDAFDDLTRAIQLQPSADAYASRALVSIKLGNEAGAGRDLDAALALDPAEPSIYVYRGALGFVREDPQAACADLSKAASLGMSAPMQSARDARLCP